MESRNAGTLAASKTATAKRAKLAPRIHKLLKEGKVDIEIGKIMQISPGLVGRIREEFKFPTGDHYRKVNAQRELIASWNLFKSFDMVAHKQKMHLKTVKSKLRRLHEEGIIHLPKHLVKSVRNNPFCMPQFNHKSKENAVRKSALQRTTNNIAEDYFIPKLREKTSPDLWEYVEQAMADRKAARR